MSDQMSAREMLQAEVVRLRSEVQRVRHEIEAAQQRYERLCNALSQAAQAVENWKE